MSATVRVNSTGDKLYFQIDGVDIAELNASDLVMLNSGLTLASESVDDFITLDRTSHASIDHTFVITVGNVTSPSLGNALSMYDPNNPTIGLMLAEDGELYLEGGLSKVWHAGNSDASQNIHVKYASSAPIKYGGHPNLDVDAWPGQGQFRITHSQGDTNFTVQVTKEMSVTNGLSEPDTAPELGNHNAAAPVVEITSTYIDVWFVTNNSFHTTDMDFFLTLQPY